jgi:hypothetical protein
MRDHSLIEAYRGRLTKEVQDAILIAGIPPDVVASLFIEAAIMLASTMSSTKEVAAGLRHAADTIDGGEDMSPIPQTTFIDRAWNALLLRGPGKRASL